MTWSVNVRDAGGKLPEGTLQNACEKCKHDQFCNVRRVAWPIGNVLTSVDVGGNGHMASGTAVLQCYGFEPKDA